MPMNRRHFIALAGTLALSAQVRAQDPFMLDVEYRKVPVPHPEKKTVTEFFFYGCPHCWHLEPSIEAWLQRKPKEVTFKRMPAVLNSPAWIFFARAYFTAENLGVLEQSHKALFDALHRDRLKLFTVEELAAWYSQYGIEPEKYQAMFKSFKVDAQVKEAAKLTRDMGIDGVPSIVVNGTWLTDVSMAGGKDRLWQVVDWLVTR